jgi:hypothetical protein
VIYSGSIGRHCERSEAIQLYRSKQNGLLRFARNDGNSCRRPVTRGDDSGAFAKAQHRRVLAPNQNIENNPMQSNEGASAWMLYPSKIF